MKQLARKRSLVEWLASIAPIFMGVGLLASFASAQAIPTPPSSPPVPSPPAFAALIAIRYNACISRKGLG